MYGQADREGRPRTPLLASRRAVARAVRYRRRRRRRRCLISQLRANGGANGRSIPAAYAPGRGSPLPHIHCRLRCHPCSVFAVVLFSCRYAGFAAAAGSCTACTSAHVLPQAVLQDAGLRGLLPRTRHPRCTPPAPACLWNTCSRARSPPLLAGRFQPAPTSADSITRTFARR